MNNNYIYTGKKGSILRANCTHPDHDITKGEELIALGNEITYNAEGHIKTKKGYIPVVHFFEKEVESKPRPWDIVTISAVILRRGSKLAMSPEEFRKTVRDYLVDWESWFNKEDSEETIFGDFVDWLGDCD